MDRDLYRILGVPRKATQEEIKKAFRRLARAYHPDFNPGNATAERKFREVQEAYEILGDSAKRASYDRFGMSYFRRRDGSGPAKTPQDVMNDFMETFLRRDKPSRRRGEDLKYYLSITLLEAAFGCDRELTIPSRHECSSCRGTGASGASGKRNCASCDGLGEIRPSGGFFAFKRPCPDCRGTGYRIVDPCKACDGKGRETIRRELKVHIPAGVDTGQRLKLRDRGNGGYHGGAVGDLYVIVHVKDHEIFRRQGSELMCDVSVSFSLAALGGELKVPTLRGAARIQLPGGVQTGKMYRLRGQGLPKVSSPGRGDLHVRIKVETPVNLSDEQRRILNELAEASSSAGSKARIVEKLKSRLQG